MSASSLPSPDKLVQLLGTLCTRGASNQQADQLAAAADVVASMMRWLGMDVRLLHTAGAPLIMAWRSGRSPATLLLYHHYDLAPTGPWRTWSHEPFQLAERGGMLYGRGVAHGIGPLAAHLQAIHALLAKGEELPCGVLILVEGEGLNGSPHLAAALNALEELPPVTLCLGSVGDHTIDGAPFCYSGSKGVLQVRLAVRGASHALPSGLAPSVRNPLWRLTWALSSIKGDDEDICITGFYDEVEGPARQENLTLRQLALDEPGRLRAWQLSEFLFGMSGAALVRAEVTLPTCNLVELTSSPDGQLPNLPAAAAALLDFQIVPRQTPTTVLEQLREHLIARAFEDIAVELLPGNYPPMYTPSDHPQIQRVAAAGAPLWGAPLVVLPLGPFALPLQPLAARTGAPTATVGVARHTSAVRGPNEHIACADLLRHGQLLVEIMGKLKAEG